MRIKKYFNNKGIILIEAIIALAVIVIVMTSLVSALVFALNTNSFSNDQTEATGYAQEGLEIARSQKDLNFPLFQSSLVTGDYCLGEDMLEIAPTGNCDTGNIDSGKYQRVIYINQNGQDDRVSPAPTPKACADDSVFVASTVSWNDSRCEDSNDRCHKIDLNTCFIDLFNLL